MTGGLGAASRRGLVGFGFSLRAKGAAGCASGVVTEASAGAGWALCCASVRGPGLLEGAVEAGASGSASLLPNIFLSALSTVISSVG